MVASTERYRLRVGLILELRWRLSRPCSGVTNQGNTTNRPLLWDDDPPAELRRKRAREDSPLEERVRPAAGRRVSPGMPLEFDDPEDDGVLRPSADRFRGPKAPWWRPATKARRVVLLCASAVVLGAFVTAYLSFAHFLERDARFRIAGSDNIEAAGLTEVTRADLMPVFGEDIGRNIFFVPLSARRRELEQIPWIEHATVMRVLPDQIRVSIVERQPVAFTRHGNTIGLVDANGTLLAMSPKTMAQRHYSFPVVTGIDAGDSVESRKERMAVYMRLMAELDAGGQHRSEQISEIDLTDPEDARVLLPEQGADILAHFGEDQFSERYERYKAHIAEWRQQYPHLKSVDLRYENQVVLEMASGAQASDASAGSASTTNAPALEAVPESKPPAKVTAKKSATKRSKPAPGKHVAAKRTAANTGRRNPARTSSSTETGGEGN